MCHLLIALALVSGVICIERASASEVEPHRGSVVHENDSKHNWSLGLFDDRAGLSLLGYTYNLRQTDKVTVHGFSSGG